jgi:SAM-dependent methyltransferase
MMSSEGYAYYRSENAHRSEVRRASREVAALYSRAVLDPSPRDPDYLVRRARREILGAWMSELESDHLQVLDVGGRVQPWRPLLGERVERYVGLDPVLEGLVDVVASGECIPFADGSFDLVICTQALTYAADPARMVDEMHRVLVPSGVLLLSTTAMCPEFHDERWRFLPGGLKILLAEFSRVEIVPEGHSIAGVIRLINVGLSIASDKHRVQQALGRTLNPLLNRIAPTLDRFSRGSTRYTTNYSVRAVK